MAGWSIYGAPSIPKAKSLTPYTDQPAIDPDKHLIEMPGRMRLGPASSKVSCDRRSEVSHPAAHRLIGHHDAALSQQVLDIPEAEGKPGIEPDGLLNNHGWEAISA